jgi:hypothetical protein
MTTRAFAIQVAVFAALLGALNIAIQRLTVNAVPRQLLRSIDSTSHVESLLAGNSLVAAGLDASTYAATRGRGVALNIALGSTSPIEHDLLFRRALALRPARLVYGFFDAQLTESPSVGWTDLFGNRAAAFYVEPDVAERFIADGDRWRRYEFRVLRHVPMFVERATIWARVERWRRWLKDLGMPEEAEGRFGRIADFAELEPLAPAEFRASCSIVVAARTPLSAPILDLLVEARRHGTAVQIVEMPQSAAHRTRYYDTPEWAAYRRYVEDEVRRLGATYVQASDWMPDTAFEDGMHLSAAGARTFSVRLASVR